MGQQEPREPLEGASVVSPSPDATGVCAKQVAYLAGPMRGYAEYNFPAFHAAAAKLRGHGLDVWSPAEHDVNEDGFDPAKDTHQPMKHYMRRDLPAVLDADMVCVLPGWEKSQGACLEVLVAQTCGIPVYVAETMQPIPSKPSETATPTLWWNGLRKDDERDGTGPSVSEVEDTNHDIPLYSGANPHSEQQAVWDMLLLDGNCSDHTLTGAAKLRRIIDDLIEAKRPASKVLCPFCNPVLNHDGNGAVALVPNGEQRTRCMKCPYSLGCIVGDCNYVA